VARMGTRTRPMAARSRRFLAGFAAAVTVTGLTASPADAQTPIAPPPVEVPPPRTPPVQNYYETSTFLTVAGPVVGSLHLVFDLGAAFHPDMHPASVMVRPGLALRLPLGLSIGAGYSYVSFWNVRHERGEEQAVYQQVGWEAPVPGMEVFARLRGEARLRERSDVALRLRMLGQLGVPLWNRAPLLFVLWNEVFLGLNQPAPFQPRLLDQDVFFVGMGWGPHPHFRADFGYQGAIVPRPDETALVHALSISAAASW
jgi:hypothetical protein